MNESTPLLNRRYLLPRAALAAGMWAFLTFGFDPLLRVSVVQSVGRAAGVRPDLAAVRTAALPTRLELDGFALPDAGRPDRNLLSFDRLTADLDADALLRRRLHVTGGTLTGLTFDTPRETAAVELDSLRFPLLDPASVLPLCDGLLDARGALGELPALLADRGAAAAGALETVRLARRLRVGWEERFISLTSRAAALEERSQALSNRLNAARDPGADPLARLRTLAEIAEDAGRLAADADALRRELPPLSARAAEDRAALAAAKRRDAARLRSVADAARGDADAAARALLGPALSQRLTATLAVARWLRARFGEPEALPAPPPMRGVRVPFPPPAPRPAILLENLAVTGALPTPDGPIPFAGTLTGLTDDPALSGRPLSGSFTARAGDGASGAPRFVLSFTHDAAAGEPVTDLELHVAAAVPDGAQVVVGDVPVRIVGRNDEEPAAVEWAARLRLTGRGADAAVRGALDLRLAARLGVDGAEGSVGETKLARLVNDAAAELPGLTAALRLSGRAGRPEWRLETDAGEQLTAALYRSTERALADRSERLLAAADAAETRFLTDLSGRWGTVAGGLRRVVTATERLGGASVAEAPGEPWREGLGRIRRTAARLPTGGGR